MNNDNRLINLFKRQTKNSIFKLLTKLAEDDTVCSLHIKDFDTHLPHLKDIDAYIYATLTNVVLVYLDHYKGNVELADEEIFNGEDPQYFTQTSHRVSPVWKLHETLKAIEYRMAQQLIGNSITLKNKTLHGVLISDSSFINVDDMREEWRGMNITVIESVDDVSKVGFCSNFSFDRQGMAYIDAVINRQDLPEEKPLKESVSLEPEDDFEQMLQNFINSEFEAKDNGNDAVADDDEEEEEKECADEPDDRLGEDPFDDADFPLGEVQQNGNLSVKVEILRPIAHPREELNKLVGCEDIKRRMDELLALVRYNQQMNELFPDSKQHYVSLHSLFLGRPGTGKTTVCKIFGSLLHEAGVLSKGHVVVANRSTFIGTLWGDEERSVNQLIEKAQGGVLMIDEAYLLDSGSEKDPGRLVIQLLMNILADESQRDIAVVLCGYREPMQKLLDTNPGLYSRFPNRFEFNDFTVDELLKITRYRIKEYQYRFTRSAWIKYRDVLDAAYQVRDPKTWGNARFVANQLENIYIRHATRCISHPPRDKRRMRVLTPADIQPIEVPREKPRLGFC